MKIIRFNSKELQKIYSRYLLDRKNIKVKISKIIDDVKNIGDDALIRFTKKFDKVKLFSKQLKVTEAEISAAFQNINPNFISNLKIIIENINRFYKKQLKKSWKIRQPDGIILGEKFTPFDRVGIYIPSGTAPLISSVYMSVIPARIAGVRQIVLVTPPNKKGEVNPYILAIANLLKVNQIYKVGGAQAIAALAFGTKSIPKVDKIVGPGNRFVTEAKRQVFGFVDIDMLAGPTELVIIANRSSNPLYVKADLIAQSEHVGGLGILVTTSKSLAKHMKTEVEKGYIIVAKNLMEAIDITNNIAPEHLQIMVSNPSKLVKYIRNAGAIFLGEYSPVAVGDYVAGPSHILPTGGTARFFSGLGINDFMKSSHLISYTKRALEKVKEPVEIIASIEGLNKHLESLMTRFS